TQVLEIQGCGGVVEHAHHNLFAPHRGQRRHAQVNLAALMRDRETAVLRLAALGDVDVGHDLDARDHAVLDGLARTLHLMEHTVNAVPDAEVLLCRLNVNIGCTVLNGLRADEVHKSHNGRVVCDDVTHFSQVEFTL